MCFRVVRQDGKPVCCGFQSMVCTSRQTGGVVLAPAALLYAVAPLRERLRGPSFQERVLAGGTALKSVFDEETVRVGTAIAQGLDQRVVPDLLMPSYLPAGPGEEGKGVVFTFPGQGSWEPKLLQEVVGSTRTRPRSGRGRRDYPPASGARRPDADSSRRRRSRGRARPLPDLVQVASYLTSVVALAT